MNTLDLDGMCLTVPERQGKRMKATGHADGQHSGRIEASAGEGHAIGCLWIVLCRNQRFLLVVRSFPVVYPQPSRSASTGDGPNLDLGGFLRGLVVAGRLDWSVPTTHALDLVEGLIQRGHEVQMVCKGGVFLPRFRSMGIEVLVSF